MISCPCQALPILHHSTEAFSNSSVAFSHTSVRFADCDRVITVARFGLYYGGIRRCYTLLRYLFTLSQGLLPFVDLASEEFADESVAFAFNQP